MCMGDSCSESIKWLCEEQFSEKYTLLEATPATHWEQLRAHDKEVLDVNYISYETTNVEWELYIPHADRFVDRKDSTVFLYLFKGWKDKNGQNNNR